MNKLITFYLLLATCILPYQLVLSSTIVNYGREFGKKKNTVEEMAKVLERVDKDNDILRKRLDHSDKNIEVLLKKMEETVKDNEVLQMKNEVLFEGIEEMKRDNLRQGLLGNSQDIPVGTILPFAGTNFTDLFGQGWLPCEGQIVSQAQYPSLYEVIGSKFKTGSLNSKTHFQLPDFRGRFLLGSGDGVNLTPRSVGEYLGEERHTLSADEMPSHSHRVYDPGHNHEVHYKLRDDRERMRNGFSWTWLLPANNKLVTDKVPVTTQKTGISIKTTGSSNPHENMPPSSVVNFIIKAPKAREGPKPWPRPKKLVGFWPLSALHQKNDVNPKKVPTVSNMTKMSFVPGPFGDAVTAAVMGGNIETTGIQTGDSFTISFFFKSENATEPAGIFEFLDKYGTSKAFQVRRFNKTSIEIRANQFSIGLYQILQPEDAWTFLAFTFDGLTSQFTVYGKHGLVVPPTFQPHILASNSFNNDGFRVGQTSYWNETLSDGDYVSCLMLYSTALTAREIRKAYDSCRIILGAAPCGSPRLPIPAIPSATSVTTIPKQGEFPFIASLTMNSKHICSANIIDEYWLVTSAKCFHESSDQSLYQVYVGEYDLGVNETYTQERSISKIITSGVSLATLFSDPGRNIALIQVDRALDFTSDYVNNICLFTDDKVDDLTWDQTQYVFGWGVNGRQPFVSKTLGRTVPGLMMTEGQCERAWGSEEYDSENDICFMSLSNDKNVPCHNDEGSPLLVQEHGDPETGMGEHLVTVGLYYTRDGNCSAAKPALFTNLAKYSNWIAEKIACAIPGSYYPHSCPQKKQTPISAL